MTGVRILLARVTIPCENKMLRVVTGGGDVST